LCFLIFPFISKAQVVINEYSCSNVSYVQDNFGNYEDWIELYNPSTSAANIGGYWLSDNKNKVQKWQFPAGTTIAAQSHLLIWASSINNLTQPFHTNFSLKQCDPEAVLFSDASGTIIDSLTLKRTQQNHSRGRTSDGSNLWSVFLTPTPGVTNANAFKEYEPLVTFNLAPGFYAGSQNLTMSCADNTAIIRYTTDGSNPTTLSNVYSGTISVATTTLFKATAWSSTDPLVPHSFIEPNTYFINVSHTIPVLSFGGTALDTLLQGNSFYDVQDASMEYFDYGGVFQFQQVGSANKHGHDSWAYPQRGFDYVMQDEQGYANEINYKLFPVVSKRKKFDRIILKAASSDNYPGNNFLPSCHLRDAFVQSFSQVRHFDLDCRSWTPCVIYLNGNYYGVYEIRERMDHKNWTNFYYNQNEEDIDLLKYWGGLNIEYGSDTAWANTYNFLLANSMNNAGAYQYVEQRIDFSSAIDNFIYNTFIVNSDWINWNTMWWRGGNPAGKKLKWRYSLWDEDNTYNLGQNFTGWPTTSAVANPCDINLSWGDLTNPASPDEGHMVVINKLMQNPQFKTQLINRYADMLNHDLNCDTVLHYLNYMVAVLTPEMNKHCIRWGGNMATWTTNLDTMKAFINRRCTFIDSAMVNCYQLTGPYSLLFNVLPKNKGTIKASTIQLPYYPYTTKYYGNIFVPIVAKTTDTCYTFDYWEVKHHAAFGGDTIFNDTLFYNPTINDSIIANFKNHCDGIGPNQPPIKITETILFPSAFTPNGDGINDFFKVLGKNIESCNLKIYNRWGESIFESIDKNTGWDGRFNGEIVQQGVYLYSATIIQTNGVVQSLKGNVTILK
jgi:gliding motility-associated-like protein